MNNCNSTNIFDGYAFNGERIDREPVAYHDAELIDIESLHPSIPGMDHNAVLFGIEFTHQFAKEGKNNENKDTA